MWARFEPIHAVAYFTPEALAANAEAGPQGYGRGSLASSGLHSGRGPAAVSCADWRAVERALVGWITFPKAS
ncbi:hypothetical protein F4553_008084 [Allocatelliglobosispora scoriae]|uniref:Uncharacterized protein n=1 Tax=Allocatelliglobosispora scoriae TaxID=643052 RepID=A0A841C6T7_9ACTN|nr:hypothetical protein [Allocatelliglobosispora scoriae]